MKDKRNRCMTKGKTDVHYAHHTADSRADRACSAPCSRRAMRKQRRIASKSEKISDTHHGPRGVGEAEVPPVDVPVLVLRAPLVRSTFSSAVLKLCVPIPGVFSSVYSKLLLHQVLGVVAGLHAARDAVLVAAAALVVLVAPATSQMRLWHACC